MQSTKINPKNLFSLPRWQKRLIMLFSDIIMLAFAIWASYALRLSTWSPDLNNGNWLLLIAPFSALIFFTKLGLYRSIVRFISNQAFRAVFLGVSLSALSLWSIVSLAQLNGIPNSIYPIYWGTALILVGGSRYIMRHYYQQLNAKPFRNTRIPILIYGAGQIGAQLALELEHSTQYKALGFIDDNQTLHKSIIHGLSIYPPEKIEELIEHFEVKQILLAMPTASHIEKRKIIQKLEPYPIHVRTVPTLSELLSGQRSIDEIREIDIDELLGREAVAPDEQLLKRCINKTAVMVTGAGGSIGSELCRQIIRQHPTYLVLFEASEFALYQIEHELRELISDNCFTKLVPVLGSVQDRQRVEEILQLYNIETLYHAAAYKHVPLVEHNPIEGIRNNVLGTYHTAQAAKSVGVKHFVLISTDKAVRPTNVMGASKRMAELVLQGIAEQPDNTCFSMVRFGNVLGSSGSVVPLFRQQIKQGGPITVTHPDIIRYFMTIPEAAQLVIQAGALAKGGEVFLLDMGEPVKIVDLAKRMIHLNGLTIKSEENPEGDIAIEFTGLRPGEKLYEELLIDSNAQPTPHSRIRQAQEAHIDWVELQHIVQKLQYACNQRDLNTIYQLLTDHVSGFKPTNIPENVHIADIGSSTHLDNVISFNSLRRFSS